MIGRRRPGDLDTVFSEAEEFYERMMKVEHGAEVRLWTTRILKRIGSKQMSMRPLVNHSARNATIRRGSQPGLGVGTLAALSHGAQGMGKKQRRTSAEALAGVPEAESRVIIATITGTGAWISCSVFAMFLTSAHPVPTNNGVKSTRRSR